MKKQDIEVDAIYEMQGYKTVLRPVKIIRIGTYKVQVQYLDPITLKPLLIANPARWGATMEWIEAIPFSQIKNKYKVAA